MSKKDSVFSSGARIARLGEEKREWLDITNFNVWQVLKLVYGGKKHIREMIGLFRGSNTTLEFTVNRLMKWGLLYGDRSRTWPFKHTLALTENGIKMLSFMDRIGEVVKEIRRQGP